MILIDESSVNTKRALALSQDLADRAELALAHTQLLADQAKAAAAALVQRDFFDDGSYGVELAGLPEKATPETKHGKYTGQQLEERIVVRDAVVKWLAQGIGIRRIARALRDAGEPCHEASIMAFRDRRPDLVATEKKELSRQLGRIVKLAADSIEERLANGTMKPTSIDLGIFIDKKAGVDGDAAMIIEHKHTFGGDAADFARKLEEMKRAKVSPGGAPVDSEATAIDLKP